MKELEELAIRAERLRRAALQTRLRLAEQRAELERVAGTLRVARERTATTASGSAPTPPALERRATAPLAPMPAPSPFLAMPVIKPVAAVTLGKLNGYGDDYGNKGTVPFAAPLATAVVAAKRTVPNVITALMPFAAIGLAAMVAHAKIAPKLAVVVPPQSAASAFAPGHDGLVRLEPPAPAEDDGSAEALLLVHDWKPTGDGQTVLEMLGGELDRPGLPPSWTVERTGPREFLVRFRDGAVTHAFEADLGSHSVRPAGETAALFAGR